LLQHFVNERGLAMVNMRNDCDIAKFHPPDPFGFLQGEFRAALQQREQLDQRQLEACVHRRKHGVKKPRPGFSTGSLRSHARDTHRRRAKIA